MEDPNNLVAERIVRDLIGSPSNSNVTFTVSAGGAGVWFAATCCAVMLVANLFLAVLVIDHGREIDRLDDYLNAIYAQAPHLKPQEDSKP